MQKSKKNSRSGFWIVTLLAIVVFAVVFHKPVLMKIYPVKYVDDIEKYSEMYDIDKFLVMGIISSESRFNAGAQSRKDAKGLMQIKDSTASWCVDYYNLGFDEIDLFNPQTNIHIGCVYMKYLLDKYNGSTKIALAAYNAGEGNVSEWLEYEGNSDGSLEVIPFKETEKYIKTVERREKVYKYLYE